MTKSRDACTWEVEEVASLLCRVVPFSDTVDQDLLHNFQRFVIIFEALRNGAVHCLQVLGTRLRLGGIFGNIVDDPPS